MGRRLVIIFFLMIFLFATSAFLNPIPKKVTPEGFKPKYGTSFSFEQAKWYGLDPRNAYIDLISQTKFEWIRLPFFWDQMTDEEGNLILSDLRFAISEAGKRNIKVVIALGAKTPYYPEYHLPQKVKEKIKFGDKITLSHPIAAELLEIDSKIVRELSSYENISHWQIENEPFLANVNNWKIDKSLIKAEIDVVRSIDPLRRPIVLNHVGPSLFDRRWKELYTLLAPKDVFATNAYFKTQGISLVAFKVGKTEIKIPWPKWLIWPVQSWLFFSPDFEKIRKETEAAGFEFWILETQAEPYIRSLEDAQKTNYYFTPDDILNSDRFLKSQGVKSIGLWGANFWQYRQSKGDSSWINIVKKISY